MSIRASAPLPNEADREPHHHERDGRPEEHRLVAETRNDGETCAKDNGDRLERLFHRSWRPEPRKPALSVAPSGKSQERPLRGVCLEEGQFGAARFRMRPPWHRAPLEPSAR